MSSYPVAASPVASSRAPSLRLTGASVDIRSSAVNVIKWMGVDQEIFRGMLAKIFIDPVMERVKLIFDESVDNIEQRDDGVVVRFANSKEVKTYDLLVAADGLGSRIRGIMLNSKPREQIYGEDVHVAYFTINSDLLQGCRLAKWYNATGGRCIFLRPDPAGRTRGDLINVTARGDIETKKRLNEALREGNESYMKLMEEIFCDAGWVAPEVLQSMHESVDFYCSLFTQVRSPKIHDGRVVLLGDAGYATPGFGTSLAIIGGYVLAGELYSHPDDIKTALKQYEELMLPFAKDSQGGLPNAPQLLNPQTQWGIRLRNTILRLVACTKLDKLSMALAVVLGITEKKLLMPDYKWPAK
ncbi:unnamed protein product [Adineta ricciae]|uniref:FAD-binding domain-containing protein n=1 Tax=Adineta ricciae TaxID=249248 RepID=A0A815REB7_ADIRI|nr:unnamed protein product [Adineta ricciae]CAF1563529.1 unnamed protein product [Adineta ricciae]